MSIATRSPEHGASPTTAPSVDNPRDGWGHPAVISDPARLLGRGWEKIVDEASLRADPTQIASFRAHAQTGDPLADAVVEAMAGPGGPTVRAALEAGFEGGLVAVPGAPREVVAFFGAVNSTPYWLDLATVRRGQEALARAGVLGGIVLGDLSLMGGYLSRRAIKPLMATGELAEMAPRRLAETGMWWMEVTSPGALEPAGQGVAAALRVRLTHAHVRRWLNHRGDWDYEQWDHPLNQVQLAGTHLLFSVVCMGGLRRLGIHYDRSEREAIMHLWRYVGWLIGIEEALLPATESDGWRLLWLVAATELDPDGDSRALAQALHAAAQRDLPAPLAKTGLAFKAAVSRVLLGDYYCDALGLPNSTASKLLVGAVVRAISTAETGRRITPGATLIANTVGRHTRRALFDSAASSTDADRSYSRDRANR